MQAAPDRRSDTALVVLQCTLNQKLVFIGALRILKAIVSFQVSGDKAYSLSEKCHTCMLWHSKHVQLVHCSKSLAWLVVSVYIHAVHCITFQEA